MVKGTLLAESLRIGAVLEVDALTVSRIRGIHLSGLGRVARPVNHNLSRLWPLVGTTSCARSAQMNTPESDLPARCRCDRDKRATGSVDLRRL